MAKEQKRKFAAMRKYRKYLRHVLGPMMRKIRKATDALLEARAMICHGCDTQASLVASVFSFSLR